MEQNTMDLNVPAALPSGPAITAITVGVSHRAIRAAARALENAQIPYKSLGPASLHSMRILFAVPTRCLPAIAKLHMAHTVARDQPTWLATQTEDTFFAK